MELLKRIEEARTLWEVLLPHVTAPDDRTFGIWSTHFESAIVEHAFVRAGSKFRNHRGQAEFVYRYATGTMKNERELRNMAQRGAQ